MKKFLSLLAACEVLFADACGDFLGKFHAQIERSRAAIKPNEALLHYQLDCYFAAAELCKSDPNTSAQSLEKIYLQNRIVYEQNQLEEAKKRLQNRRESLAKRAHALAEQERELQAKINKLKSLDVPAPATLATSSAKSHR